MKNLLGGKTNLIAAIWVAVAMLCVALLYSQYGRAKPSIKISVLHSPSGTMPLSETPLVDAVQLAMEAANQPGGVNGQQIEPDAAYCAHQAEKLITQDGVQTLFGCWISAISRIKPLTQHDCNAQT